MLKPKTSCRIHSGGPMKKMRFACLMALLPALAFAQGIEQKPEVPVEKWTGKRIMLIGAHADDDAMSHGTLAMLQAHGNQIHIVTLTTGNVGTQDPNLSRTQLAQIRRQEELAALVELGIPGEHYINLGYDDGLLEFEDRKAVVERLVRLIRTDRKSTRLNSSHLGISYAVFCLKKKKKKKI